MFLYWIKKLMELKCTWIGCAAHFITPEPSLGGGMSQAPSFQHIFHCPTRLHLQKKKEKKKLFKDFKKVTARAFNPKYGNFGSWGPGCMPVELALDVINLSENETDCWVYMALYLPGPWLHSTFFREPGVWFPSPWWWA